MGISESKTRTQFPLSTKKVLKKTLAGTMIISIILLVIYIFGFIIFVTANNLSWLFISTIIIFGLLIFIIFITYLYQKWYYDMYFYDLTTDFIVIKKGPITPSEITIPYERVQDVYVDQDLLDRVFGLYDVHLSSATVSSGMEAHIDGVEKPAADGLRSLLLQTVSSKINRNQQQNPPPPPPTPIISETIK